MPKKRRPSGQEPKVDLNVKTRVDLVQWIHGARKGRCDIPLEECLQYECVLKQGRDFKYFCRGLKTRFKEDHMCKLSCRARNCGRGRVNLYDTEGIVCRVALSPYDFLHTPHLRKAAVLKAERDLDAIFRDVFAVDGQRPEIAADPARADDAEVSDDDGKETHLFDEKAAVAAQKKASERTGE